MYIPIAILDKK